MEYCFSENVCGVDCKFHTDDNCFSPHSADKGTLAMLSVCSVKAGDEVIDLGCGYGIVGIWAAHFTDSKNIYMLDVNKEALAFARKNALENGFGDLNIIRCFVK